MHAIHAQEEQAIQRRDRPGCAANRTDGINRCLFLSTQGIFTPHLYCPIKGLQAVLQLIDVNNTKRSLASLCGAIRSTPRSDGSDVFIATFPKVGTTVLQQIAHQLRAGGEDWDFAEISDVAPWFESLIDFDREKDLCADQKFSPRLFKSHLCYDALPQGCKVITVLREPAKVFCLFLSQTFALDILLIRNRFWKVITTSTAITSSTKLT